MTDTVEQLAELFEQPAKTAALTGCSVTVTLSAGAAQAVGTLLRAMNGDFPNRDQTRTVLRALMVNIGLLQIIKLWLLIRILRWAHTE